MGFFKKIYSKRTIVTNVSGPNEIRPILNQFTKASFVTEKSRLMTSVKVVVNINIWI